MFFQKGTTISFYCKDMVEPSYIKGVQKQRFYKIGFLENFAEFTGKHLRWSHFSIKLQA